MSKIKVRFDKGKLSGQDFYYEMVTNINEVTEQLVKDLTDEAEKHAKDICPVDTGALKSGIYSRTKALKHGANGEVICESDHAAYVEFGTGVVAKGSPYPGEMGDYKYDIDTIYKDETRGWHYGNTYTHGYKPRMFMYNTARYIEGIIPQFAKRLLNGK